jgi:hypothetical protein
VSGQHTPGPWEYVPATEHHGPYVTSAFGSTICDCYTMTRPDALSVRNGGPSKPVAFLAEMADPNAHLIAAAPDLYEALDTVMREFFPHATLGEYPELAAARAALAKARASDILAAAPGEVK